MMTRDEIIIARDVESKKVKSRAIDATRKYLEGDFAIFLNQIFIEKGKDVANLSIQTQEKYNRIFFFPTSRAHDMHPPLYDLEYFCQELRNKGFKVIEYTSYSHLNGESIVIKI